MTRDEFYDKYGKVEVTFSHYYKYVFYFVGEIPEGKITVGFGGDAAEIYRYEVTCGEVITVETLYPNRGGLYKDGKEIEGFYYY